jgi:hypothetical protein
MPEDASGGGEGEDAMKSKVLIPSLMVAAVLTILATFAYAPWPAEAQAVRESQESVAPAGGAAALVEHDTNLISPVCRSIYVGTTGNVVVDMAREGTDQTFAAVPAGTVLPIRIKRFKTASTATGVCLY